MDILRAYVSEAPSPETALRLFEGEWQSLIPGYGQGTIGLFDDSRIR